MTGLVAIADARDFRGLIEALTEVFGGEATLFAIDHAFERLVEVCLDPAESGSLPLDGDLRIAMLRNLPYEADDAIWVAIPDRNQPVLVVRTTGTAALPSSETMALLGPIVNGHRARFEELERVRRRGSMTVAAEMQWAALPNRAEQLGDYSVASVLEPAYEVAGDAFDYASFDGAVWAYSLDGMGHGIDATTASVLALSAIRNSRRTGGDLDVQMNAASAALFDRYGGGCFVTGLACRVDSGGTQFVNAGHEPGWMIADGQATGLDLRAELPLGIVAAHRYEVQHRSPLDQGDGVALFSDGPANAQSPGGAPYGPERLRTVLEAHWSDAPLQTAHDVVGDVVEFIADGILRDDLTAVVLQRQQDGG